MAGLHWLGLVPTKAEAAAEAEVGTSKGEGGQNREAWSPNGILGA